MAWENWSKKQMPQGNNDEPNKEPLVDASGLLGKEYHSYFGSKFHNGFTRVARNQIENIAGMFGAAAESDPSVIRELYNELPEDSNLWDAIGGKGGSAAAKVAVNDVNRDIRQVVNSNLWDASRAVHGLAKELPKDWESDVDESTLPYWQQIAGGVVENAPSLAANAAMYAINPLAGTAFMLGDIAGGTTSDLIDKGVTYGNAWQAGGANAAVQLPMEQLGVRQLANLYKGVPGGGTVLSKLSSLPILRSLKGKSPNSIRNAIGGAFVNEAIPEMAQEIPDEMIAYIAEHGTLDGFDYNQMMSNMVDAGLIGGITGATLATPGAIANKFRKTPQQVQEGVTQAQDAEVIDKDGNTVQVEQPQTDTVGNILNAIGGQESGGEADPYNAYNADGDAHGKYQITSGLWDQYAGEAGVDINEGMTPENQEKVARYVMSKYVDRYGEDGAIVAWYAGEGTAQAYKNGTLSEEAFTRRQGENGEYPSIKEYLEQVQGRRGQSETEATTPKRTTTKAGEPQSASDFLKDIEESTPLDTEEREAESQHIRDTIEKGTEEEQEALAREYGWGNEEQTPKSEPVTTDSEAGAPTPTNIAPAPQGGTANAEPIKTNAPQAPQPNEKKPNQVSNPGNNQATAAKGNQQAAPNPQIQQAPSQGARDNGIVGNVYNPTQGPARQFYQKDDVPVQTGNRANPETQRLINKALTNPTIKGLVEQAFVNGDKDAQARLNAMNIKPEVLEAVKGAVIPGYVPRGNVNAGANARTPAQQPTQGQLPATQQPAGALPIGKGESTTEQGKTDSEQEQPTTTPPPKPKKNDEENDEETPKGSKEEAEKFAKPSEETNTEEKKDENAEKIRELLHSPNEDNHGDTESEKGGKQETKDGEETTEENPVKEETKEEKPKGEQTEETKDEPAEKGTESDKKADEGKEESESEEESNVEEAEGRKRALSDEQQEEYNELDPSIKSDEWEKVDPENGFDMDDFDKAQKEANKDNKDESELSTQLGNEAFSRRGSEIAITKNGSAGVIVSGGWIYNLFKSPTLKAKNAIRDIILIARALGGNRVTVQGMKAINEYEKLGYQPVARDERGRYWLVNYDSFSTVVKNVKNGEYETHTKEELEAAVPLFSGIDGYGRANDYVNEICAGHNGRAEQILKKQKETNEAIKKSKEIYSDAKKKIDGVIKGYMDGKGNKQLATKAISAIVKKVKEDIKTADPKGLADKWIREDFNSFVEDRRAELKDAKREKPAKKEPPKAEPPKEEPAKEEPKKAEPTKEGPTKEEPSKEKTKEEAKKEEAASDENGKGKDEPSEAQPTESGKSVGEQVYLSFKEPAKKIIHDLYEKKKDPYEALDDINKIKDMAIQSANKLLAKLPIGAKDRLDTINAMNEIMRDADTAIDMINDFIRTRPASEYKTSYLNDGTKDLNEEHLALFSRVTKEMERLIVSLPKDVYAAARALLDGARDIQIRYMKETDDKSVQRRISNIVKAHTYKKFREISQGYRLHGFHEVSNKNISFTATEKKEIEIAKKLLGNDSKLFNDYYMPALRYLAHFTKGRETATESAFLYAKMAQSFHENYGIWFPPPRFEQIYSRAGSKFVTLGAYGMDSHAFGLSLKYADPRTFLHEATHMYHAMLISFSEMSHSEIAEHFGGDKAKAQEAADKIKKDLASIAEWAQYSEEHLKEYEGTALEKEYKLHAQAVLNGTDIGELTWRTERIARGAEKYFFTGEAPTNTLKRFFQRLKDVLVSYLSGRDLMKGELPPEVKAFYDKMVAGDPDFFKQKAEPKKRNLVKATVYTDDGNKVNVTYEIVPASTLITSSDYNFVENDKYPKELQPRDRARDQMKAQVNKLAPNLNPDLLMESQHLNEGAPIVNADNIVENGNGRIMSITKAYDYSKDGTAYKKSADGYRKALIENAERFGYTKEEIEAMDRPILVKRRGHDSDNLVNSIVTSTTGGMRLSASQQAFVDAKNIPDHTMDKLKWDEEGGGDVTKKAYDNFVVSVLEAITGPNDKDVVYNSDGTISDEGYKRVRAAIAAKAYGETSLIERAFENSEGDGKNLINAFIIAAPKMAKLRTRLENGEIDKQYNLPKILSEALNIFLKAKKDRKSINIALNESSMFGETSPGIDNPQVRVLVKFFDANTRGQKAIVNAINDMVDSVFANEQNMDNMFGDDVGKSTIDDVVRAGVGLRESPFVAGKPTKNGAKAKIKKLVWDALSQKHMDAIANIAEANGGTLNRKTGEISFKDYNTQMQVLDVLNAYYTAASKETDCLKFSIVHQLESVTKTDEIDLPWVAWHGSPYDFDHFDLSFIGQGEGAQAHGWGIYFARSTEYNGIDDYGKAVSEGYKERLGKGVGKLFKVAIPSEEYLLDEQTPIADQPKHVQECVIKAFKNLPPMPKRLSVLDSAEVYSAVAKKMDSELQKYFTIKEANYSFAKDRTTRFIFEDFFREPPRDFEAFGEGAHRHRFDRALDHMYKSIVDTQKVDEQAINDAGTNPLGNKFSQTTTRPPARKLYDIMKKGVWNALKAAESEAKKIADETSSIDEDIFWDAIQLVYGYSPSDITSKNIETLFYDVEIRGASSLSPEFIAAVKAESDFAASGQSTKDEKRLKDALLKAVNESEPIFRGGKMGVEEAKGHIDNAVSRLKDKLQFNKEVVEAKDLAAFVRLAQPTGAKVQAILANWLESSATAGRTDEKIAMLLKDAGLKGYKYNGVRDGPCAVVFDEAAMKIIEKFSRKGSVEKLRDSISHFCSPKELNSREQAIVSFAKKMGLNVQFFDGDPNLHGFHTDGSNTVFLNRKSAMDLNKVFWHETFHWMRENNSNLYNQLVREVFGDEVSLKQLADYAASIGRTDMSRDLCIEEMLADAMFDAGKRGKFFEKIGAEHPSLCAKLLKWISNLYKDFMAHFHNPEAGLTNTQIKRMATSLSEIANRIVDRSGNKLFEVDEKGNIKETPAGREAIAGDVKYKVTNKNVKETTQVKITDVTGVKKTNPLNKQEANALLKSLVGQQFKIENGIGEVVRKDNQSAPGENRNAGKQLLHSHDNNLSAVLNNVRRKALTVLSSILKNCVYIDKHPDTSHGTNTKYIELFAPVRNGNDIHVFRITARERGKAGLYEVGHAIYYNIKKVGKLISGPQRGIKSNSLPTTISVAEMLADVKDRNGNPYVINGKLNYEQGIFNTPTTKAQQTQQAQPKQPQSQQTKKHIVSDSNETTTHTSEELKAQVMSNFPNAQNIVETENGISFDLPNGMHVEANITDETISIDWGKAQKDYGGNLTGKERAMGSMETVDRDAIMTLTKDTVEEAPSHEAMHLGMGLLTERERNALYKKYGNEEAICEAMREWKIRRNEGKGTSMGKIMQKISDIAHKLLGLFHETDKNIFRKLEQGELWEREADNKAAAKVSYLLDPSKNMDDFMKSYAEQFAKDSVGKFGSLGDMYRGASDWARKFDGENGFKTPGEKPTITIDNETGAIDGEPNQPKAPKPEASQSAKIEVTYETPLEGMKKAAEDFGTKAQNKYEAAVKPELHKAKQNKHVHKMEKGQRGGWGAIDWILNNTVRSASRIKSFAARRIYSMGDAAIRRMSKLRGAWTDSFSRAIAGMTDADKEKFNDILWQEDANQHVFTDAELKEMGCTDTVIRAHRKTRNLLRKIYNAVNEVYTRTKVENYYYDTMQAAKAAQTKFTKRPHTEAFKDIKEVQKDGKTQYQVSIRTRGYHEETKRMTEAQIEKLKADKDCFFKDSTPTITAKGEQATTENGELVYTVTYLQYNRDLTNMEGYMPHLFKGIMIVHTYTDKDGKVHREVVGSADNMDQAVIKADKMQKESGGEYTLCPKQFSSEGEVESSILLGDNDYDALMNNLRNGMSISLEDARNVTNARKKGRHVSYTAIKKRKGAKGFESNAIWAIQHHINSSARYVALDQFKTEAINFFERKFGNYDDDWSNKNREAAWIKGYIDSVLGKPSVLENVANNFLQMFPMFKDDARPAKRLASNLTRLTGVLKLGVSPAAGFVNMLQILNCVGYVGARKTAVGIKRALHLSNTDLRILKSAGADEEVGLAFDGIDEMEIENSRRSKTADTLDKLNKMLMLPFTTAERTIRRATILAAYYDYIEKNKDRVTNPTDLKRLAINHALEINRKVNFDYSVADSPRIFRAVQGTVLGDVALQFQKYGVKELEVISDFLPIIGKETTTKQKIEFFVPYLLVSGLWNAFPFEDAILALLGMLFGIDDPEKEAKKAMIEWAGKDEGRKALVDVANYGVGALAGVDISQRVGLKGVVPETNNILQGGPAGSTAIQLAKAIANSDVSGGLKATSPALGNIYGAAVGYNTDSKGRKVVDYDGWDKAVRALGFRTTKEAHATDAQSIVYNYKQSKAKDRAKAKEAYLDNPSSANYQKLIDLGYSKNEIKKMKNDKETTRASRSENGLSKDDKKKLQSVLDSAK